MTLNDFSITAIDIRNASDDDYAATNHFGNAMRAERMPDDPPLPLDEHITNCKNIQAEVRVYVWLVRKPESREIVASASVGVADFDHSRNSANASIDVLPEFRCRGIARDLLPRIAETVRRENRKTLMAGSCGRIPAGAAFLDKLGATRALESHMNQLTVDELDRDLLAEWNSPPAETSAEFHLTVQQGPYAEADLPAITALFNEGYNSMPRGDLQMDDFNFTAEQLRQFEKSMLVGGRERWSVFARDRATNAFAGYTEVVWNPNRPMILGQRGTAVLPQYRQKRLGRWMKAKMLIELLAAHPEIKFVRTENANQNAAMLAINNALGFKPYQSETSWQIEIDKVFAYLARNRAA